MKQNKWNKILIPAVVLIWIGVLLRFLGPISTGNEGAGVAPSAQIDITDSGQNPFELSLAYEDPFSHSSSQPKPKNNQSVRSRRSSKLVSLERPKPKWNPPALSYQGGVQKEAGSLTGLLSVDGKLIPVQHGDHVSGLLVQHPDLYSVVLVHPDTSIHLLKH